MYSAVVMSEVQQRAFAGEVALAGVKGTVHLAARAGRVRMSVVVCKSQSYKSTSQQSLRRSGSDLSTYTVTTNKTTIMCEADIALKDTS